jgi:hypothetical protein
MPGVMQPAALAILGVMLVAAWPVGRWIARRYGRPPVLAVLYVAAVGIVLALTLPVPILALRPRRAVGLLEQFTNVPLLGVEIITFGSSAEQWGNVLLFLPVGLLGALVLRSAARAAGLGALLSVLVEVWQSAVGRGGEVGDVLHTAAGAVLGAVCAAVVLRIRPPHRRAGAGAD